MKTIICYTTHKNCHGSSCNMEKTNPSLQQSEEIRRAGIQKTGKGKYVLPASGITVNRRVALTAARTTYKIPA